MRKEYFVYGFSEAVANEIETKVNEELGSGDPQFVEGEGFPSGDAMFWVREGGLCITLYYEPPALHGSEVDEDSDLGKYFSQLESNYQTE
jgi:hypothetical protein